MPNKSRKFDRTYIINVSGYSRGPKDGKTSVEEVVGKMIKNAVAEINRFYQDTDATLEEVDNIQDNKLST